MKRRIASGLLVLAAAASTIGLAPTAASADTGSGRDYGQHVAECARTMGFDGTHNPGMHRGYAGHEMPHDMC